MTMGEKPAASQTGTPTPAPSKGLDIQRIGDVLRIASMIPMRPVQNDCVYLGVDASIETELTFSTFFDQDHTIAGWYMPQYPRGGHGAIFAGNGTGRYF